MKFSREKISWAMYDWANSAFATIVMAGFFPVFFKQYWNSGVPVADSTFRLGVANSLASLLIVLLAPILGTIADKTGRRKSMLIGFAFLGLTMTACLYLVQAGDWVMAMVLYILAIIGFSGGNIFYDALLPEVADRGELDMLSAIGYSLGYLGGGLLLLFCVLLTRYPQWFGLVDVTGAVRIAFLLVGLWWFVFSIPLLWFVRERESEVNARPGEVVLGSFKHVWRTLHKIRSMRQVWLFLLAYWLYIDGVDTVIRMAVDYGLSLGIGSSELITALLITQFAGFPAALVFGKVGDRYSAKAGILAGLCVYMMVTLFAAFMDSAEEFYILALVIGLAQGGVQALSRSMFASMIPENQSAEYFGFYNMLGKFAAIFGPLLMGLVGSVTGNPRVGILSLLLLFVVGALILYRVDH